jgi:hypothetical protein
MPRLTEESVSLLYKAARALDRAKDAAADGGAETATRMPDADLQTAALAEIETARRLIDRAISN